MDRFTEPKLAVEASRRSIRKLAFKAHEITVERHREFDAAAKGHATGPPPGGWFLAAPFKGAPWLAPEYRATVTRP